jgi:hypothetical protein
LHAIAVSLIAAILFSAGGHPAHAEDMMEIVT